MRIFTYLASILIYLCVLSCSSTSEGDAVVKEEISTGQPAAAGKTEAKEKTETGAVVAGGIAGSNDDCSSPPEPVMCCQAMTPACNECREKSRLGIEKWQQDCGAKTKSAGCGSPPVAKCCKGAGSECKTCRDEAQLKITAWRKSCGIKEAINCAEKPSAENCCTTGEPSCEACKKRMGRLMIEFARQCGK